ncbi:MAG: hypothetical protein CL681_00760 [Blastopirellula sp.]|nr:hypothetical protein [Blastopirellula sp.]
MQISNAFSKRGLLSEFRVNWQNGNDVDVHTFLARYPSVDGKSVLVDLAYEEYCLRHERGEAPTAEAFCERFPDIRCSLRRVLEVHSYMGDVWNKSFDTWQLGGAIEWPVEGSESHGFSIVRQLGQGGLARVYLAKEPRLGDRLVAVKFSLFGGYEAETIGKLVHANIVTAHSVQEDSEGVTAICMPYFGAATLSNVLDMVMYCDTLPTKASVILQAVQDAEPPNGVDLSQEHSPVFSHGSYVDGVLHLTIDLAKGLSHAHQRGVIHGDVKPSNVLVTPAGRAMLLDFNLSLDDCVEQGRIGGTLAYMAPEQIHAVFLTADDVKVKAQIDERSDVFSLAVMAYQLLTGKLPFANANMDDALRQAAMSVLEDRFSDVPPLRSLNPAVHPDLADLIHRCLQPKPESRPDTAADLLRQLEQFANPPKTGRRAFIAAAGVGLVGLAAGTYAYYVEDPLETGITLVRAGEYDQAVDVLTRLLERDARHTDILFARATAYRLLEQYGEAIKDYREVQRIDRQTAEQVEFPLGYCYIIVGSGFLASATLKGPRPWIRDVAWKKNYWYSLTMYGDAATVVREVTNQLIVAGNDAVLHHIRLLAMLRGPANYMEVRDHAPRFADEAVSAVNEDGGGYPFLFFDIARVYARGKGLYPDGVQSSLKRAVEEGIQGEALQHRDFDPYREDDWFRQLMEVEHDVDPPSRLEMLTVKPSPNPRLAPTLAAS